MNLCLGVGNVEHKIYLKRNTNAFKSKIDIYLYKYTQNVKKVDT